MTSKSKGFPDENELPSRKIKEEWLRQYAQAVLGASERMAYGQLGYSSRALYRDLWNYALGRQELNHYIELSGIDPKHPIFSEENSRLPLSNRFFNVVVGLIEKQGWKIRVGTIDPQAKMELKEKQVERKARLLMRQAMPEAANHPLIAAQPGEPDDLEGLEIMAMGERHPIAADAQDIIRAVFNYNKYPRIRRELIQWLFVAGACAVKDSTECDGIPIEVVPLSELVIPYCRYPDFIDAPYMGRRRRVLISSLPQLSNGEITKEDIEKLYKEDHSWCESDDPYDGDSWWHRATCEVLDLEIKSLDTIKKEEYRNREGNLRYRDVVIKKDGGEKEVQGAKKFDYQIENKYTVSLIIGTDLVYNCGKEKNMKRDPNNEARVLFSYHVMAPGIREMKPYSRMQAIRPMVDDIQVLNYKIRWTLARVVPSGHAIDLDALEDIDLVAGGKAMSKKEVLDLYARTGRLLFRKKMVNGQKGNDLPIIPITSGVGNEMEHYADQLDRNIQLIRDTLGLNEATDGSTVNAKNLNSTNQAMMIGTNNALSDLFFADKQMAEDVAGAVIIRAWDMLREDEHGKTFADALAAIVGQDTVERIKNAPRLDAYRFGITIENDPSPAEVEDFNMALNEALRAGQIMIDERFQAKIIASDNILQAQLYLSYRVRKNAEETQRKALEAQQANAQAQIQSAQAAEEAKRETYKFQIDEEIRKAKELHPYVMEEKMSPGAIVLEKERIAASGRVESAFVQAKGRDENNMRDNTGKLIKEGHSELIGAVNIPADLESRVEPVTSNEQPALPKAAFSFLQAPQQAPAQEAPQEQDISELL